MNDLRDLSNRIRETARNHPAQAQAGDIVAQCCNHLDLLAGYSDLLNGELMKEPRDKINLIGIVENPKCPRCGKYMEHVENSWCCLKCNDDARDWLKGKSDDRS